jgi:hypothetical protein
VSDFINLKFGEPQEFTPKYADHRQTSIGERIMFKMPDGMVLSLPWALHTRALELGIIREDGFDKKTGGPAFKPTGLPLIVVQRSKTEYELMTAHGAPPQTGYAKAQAPQSAPTQTMTRPHLHQGGPGMPNVAPNYGMAAEEGNPFAYSEGEALDVWGEMRARYAKCAAIAADVWGTQDKVAVVAAAATLFIEANKRGLPVPQDAAA